eukprot:CAMPEP_0178956402 /NCGR_PEP_ID=MMETSP0789-20121207/10227_1 /TAXON_ID=3005 /ORGANISM="Rhizosolenia setigera, Strain CCMP 1694" /LENGTH=398 /DNA_ID=CAMNT_0020638313 /DNA_START=233 /DNA_END=1429 /DNA_ORIENTATION=-
MKGITALMNKKQQKQILAFFIFGPALLFVNSHPHHVHKHKQQDGEVELHQSHNESHKESLLLRTLHLLLQKKNKSSSRIPLQYSEMYHKECGTKDVDNIRKHNMKQIYDDWVERYQSIINSEGEGGDSSGSLSFSYKFDVYFHIIHDGDQGYLSDDVVEAAIANLNSGFAGNELATCVDYTDDDYIKCAETESNVFQRNKSSNGPKKRRAQMDSTVPGNGINTGISFLLKGITRTDNADWFRGMEDMESSYKTALHQGDCRTLNIYSGDSAYLGWTHYPDMCSSKLQMDGVVIDYTGMPGGDSPNYNEGDSLTHEVGHWLGLFHTFEGGCDDLNGDFVGDTAPQDSYTVGCPARQDTCSGGSSDPIHNFMDYSYDCCMDSFTPNQRDRMVSMIQYYRS